MQVNRRHLLVLIILATAAASALLIAARGLLPAQPSLVQIPTLAALPTGAPVATQLSDNRAPAAAHADAAADASVNPLAAPPATVNESEPAAPVAQTAAQLPAAQPVLSSPSGQPVTIPVVDNPPSPPVPAIQRLAPLFGEVDSAVLGAMDAPEGLGVARSRAVTLHLPVLEQALSAQSSGGRFMLNLFDDAVYIANAVSRTAHPSVSDGYIWQGQISEQAWSQVLFAVSGGQLEGHIWLPNVIYSVRAAGNDVYFVQELDPNAFARPHTPLVPPLPSADEIAAAAALPELAPASALNPVQIDILIAYTDDARAASGGTQPIQNAIALAVHSTNQAYINSGVFARLRLVSAVEVGYNETGDMSLDLQRITNQDGVLDELLTLRNAVAADVVTLITNPAVPDFCGLAWLMNSFYSTFGNPLQFANFAYNVVYLGCLPGGLTLAHEVGHIMGLDHDRSNSGPDAPILPYAFGYQHPNGFLRDVMAYANGCLQPCPAINYFSSASNRFGQLALGDSMTDGSGALNFTAPYVAQFRGSAPVIVPTATPPPRVAVTPDLNDPLYPPPDPCQVNIPAGDFAALSNAVQSAPANVQTVICLASNSVYIATAPLPVISGKTITLVGNGSRLTKNPMSNFRFFTLRDFGWLRMYTLTVENGYAATGSGGAIHLEQNGRLVVVNSTFRNNRARDYGGAIHSDSRQSIEIEGTTFYHNSASFGGALAILGNTGSAYVQISNFVFNAAQGDTGLGSAVYTNSFSPSILENSCFTSNANVSIVAQIQILYARNSWWGRPSGPITPASPEPQAGVDAVGAGVIVSDPLTQSPAWCNTTDFTPPVITLNGANPYELLVGVPYIEPGFSAFDAVSGDLTASVNVSGSLNTNVPGTYVLTYSVADGAGNSTSVTRTVNVISSDANLVRNGGFTAFSQFYSFQGFLAATIDSGVLNTRRTSPLGTAFIGNLLPSGLPAHAPLDLTLDLGNSSGEAKRLSVIVRDTVSGQQVVCPFVVPPNTLLTRYAMRARTPAAWAQPEFRLSLEDLNVQSLLVDNILLQYKPSLAVTATECSTPLVPERNYLIDGDFNYWGFNWNFSGFIAAIVNNGVLNTRRTAPFGFALVNQPTRLALPAGTAVEYTVEIGNSSNEAKLVSLQLRDALGTAQMTCAFNIAPNTPLQPYRLQGRTSTAWGEVEAQFFAEDINIPWLLVDNLNLQVRPSLSVTTTQCLPTLVPDRNYILNANFDYGNLFWDFSNNPAVTFSNGVLQMNRTAGSAPALLSQSTRVRLTDSTRFEANIQLGNSSAGSLSVRFFVGNTAGTQNNFCFFTIPANSPLQTYTLRATPQITWDPVVVLLFVDSATAPVQIDNLSLRYVTVTDTPQCVSPGGAAPLPPTMPAMPTLELMTEEPKPTATPTATASAGPVQPSPTAEATETPRGIEPPTSTATPPPTSTDVVDGVPSVTPAPPTATPPPTATNTETPTPTPTTPPTEPPSNG